MPNDVHVIDLRDRSRDKARVERSTNEQLPEVVVELGPELTEGKDCNNVLLSNKPSCKKSAFFLTLFKGGGVIPMFKNYVVNFV